MREWEMRSKHINTRANVLPLISNEGMRVRICECVREVRQRRPSKRCKVCDAMNEPMALNEWLKEVAAQKRA